MRSAYLKAIFVALVMIVAAPPVSYAADATPIQINRAPASVAAAGTTDTIVIEQASPVVPAPVVRHGCSRIWRCDAVICEWRRGCFGVYGYMEGPYHTLDLTRRQWERHGWPVPPAQRERFSFSK